MALYFITKQFQTRKMAYDKAQNVLWVDPNFKEKFFMGQQVGFNLDLLRSIEQYPALSQKVAAKAPLVFFTLHLKDMKVAVGVDEDGLAFVNGLAVPETPSINGNPIVQRKLK
ncbi:MAG TPA: hypothetical protein DHV36_25295 [Desulfobacteraceae bacterium]|nr:hypothetical protein [Desulfobacteraceae bacterium]|tara:strand:- start:854 stop:1192 length:339 start_codon:yes stop_codon:yes gene_type:complete